VHLARDERGRLHCETRGAIEYSDGWGVYAWHGTRVPEAWIKERAKLDPTIALTWPNIEQRRCAAEIIGWARVLQRLDTKVINTSRDPAIGTLLEVNLPDAGPARFLRVRCGTGREFVLPVPVEMRTALEANAWGYDIPQKLLRMSQVRT
jgi:hypothetical protein